MIVGWAIEQLWLSVWRPLLAPFWLPHLSCYKALIGSIGTFDIFGEARWGRPKSRSPAPGDFLGVAHYERLPNFSRIF